MLFVEAVHHQQLLTQVLVHDLGRALTLIPPQDIGHTHQGVVNLPVKGETPECRDTKDTGNTG